MPGWEASLALALDITARAPNLSVVTFELACLEMAVSAKRWQIVWDREPTGVMLALDREAEIPPAEADCHYVMQMGADVPGRAVCARECARTTRFSSRRLQ